MPKETIERQVERCVWKLTQEAVPSIDGPRRYEAECIANKFQPLVLALAKALIAADEMKYRASTEAALALLKERI